MIVTPAIARGCAFPVPAAREFVKIDALVRSSRVVPIDTSSGSGSVPLTVFPSDLVTSMLPFVV